MNVYENKVFSLKLQGIDKQEIDRRVKFEMDKAYVFNKEIGITRI